TPPQGPTARPPHTGSRPTCSPRSARRRRHSSVRSGPMSRAPSCTTHPSVSPSWTRCVSTCATPAGLRTCAPRCPMPSRSASSSWAPTPRPRADVTTTDWADRPAEAFRWLDAHVNLESLGVPAGRDRRTTQPTLARMEALAALLGSPQLEYGVMHLTGTNGKTSVARIASALLVEAGVSTGIYTSPHLERVNERMGWDGAAIDDR